MGLLFVESLPGPKVFKCKFCGVDSASPDAIVSKDFRGRHGRAYLFESVRKLIMKTRNTKKASIFRPDPKMETKKLCTVERRGRVHLVTLTGAGDHRLSPALLDAIRSAVAASAGAGALVLAAEGKYFSNGFDQAWARTAPPHLHATMDGGFRALVADLLALPMPTVAAVTGHAAAAGCALALAHDAVVMRGSRGFLYMSEVDAGIKIVDFVAELLREKVPDAVTRRDLLLRGDKMTAAKAMRRGIVDAAVDGGVEDVVAAAVAAGEELAARGWDGEVIAEIRKAAWPAVWSKVKDHGAGAAAARPRL